MSTTKINLVPIADTENYYATRDELVALRDGNPDLGYKAVRDLLLEYGADLATVVELLADRH